MEESVIYGVDFLGTYREIVQIGLNYLFIRISHMSGIGNPESQIPEEYSIWLKPDNEVYDVFKRIIDSLSDEFAAPKFEPHITVVGSIKKSVDEIQNVLKIITAESDPMSLYLTETGYLDSYYRSLFVHVAPNDALLTLREKCLTRLKMDHHPYVPHVSLLYKELEVNRKQKIIERVGKRFDLVFIPDKLYLMQTGGSPENWKEIMQISLLPGSPDQ